MFAARTLETISQWSRNARKRCVLGMFLKVDNVGAERMCRDCFKQPDQPHKIPGYVQLLRFMFYTICTVYCAVFFFTVLTVCVCVQQQGGHKNIGCKKLQDVKVTLDNI